MPVSSGGMPTWKPHAHDSELHHNVIVNDDFDGTSVYAQNKHQQVWSEECPEIFFATMHPGWVDISIYRGQIDRIDGISQVTHVARSVRRWQASLPNLLIDVSHVSLSESRRDDRHQFRLRTLEQGVDAVVWLAMTPRFKEFDNDSTPVPTYLTLTQTHSSEGEKQDFMAKMTIIGELYIHS
ncbi:hypothetical protein ACTXT7_006664 [Hymenolepis weldensis]